MDGMEFAHSIGPDEVRPVTCVRVMAALTDLGVKYRVDEDDDNEFIASWPGYLSRLIWDGPFDPTLRVSARLWADMSTESLPDLQRWLSDYNKGVFQPVVTYVPNDEGSLFIVIRGYLSLKGGLSDEQLRENLDRLLRSISESARTAATEFPELTHTESSYLRSIGVPELDLQLPVTLDRIMEVLQVLAVEDLGVWGDVVGFDVGDCSFNCTVEHEGAWLQVRSAMEEGWGNEFFGQLVEIANDLNCEHGQAAAFVERVGKWYRIAFESNTAISGGLTTAQLGEALRDAVWGQEHLWGLCLERVRAMENSSTSEA